MQKDSIKGEAKSTADQNDNTVKSGRGGGKGGKSKEFRRVDRVGT